MARPTQTEELPEELPPLDGEDEETGEAGADEDDLDPLPEGSDDPFDDATGEGDPVGTDWLDPVAESSAEDDAEPDESLALGEETELFADSEQGGWLEPGAADSPEAPDEDPDLVELEAVGADAGEEGPLDADEGLDEEDLPSLDADDGGEGDDAHFFDSLSAEDTFLPWAAQPWDGAPIASHLGIGRIAALAPAAGGAVGLGDKLVRIALDGAVVPLAGSGLPIAHGTGDESRALTTSGDALFVITNEGIYRSDDGGETFAVSDETRVDENALALAAARDALTLPRGFELAAATHEGPSVLAVVRALTYGRLYVVRMADIGANRAVHKTDANRAVHKTGANRAVHKTDGNRGVVRANIGEIVAEIAEPEADLDGGGDGLAAAWDPLRRVLWLGGGWGVLALAERGSDVRQPV